MRDNRFIELVNLYIDRQITAEETAELETEMQGNPRRRALYRQYCQLHSATKQVYERFRANADGLPSATPGGRAVTAIFNNRSRFHWIHYAGGLAAAACLAFLFVRYNANPQPTGGPIAGMIANPTVQTVAVAPAGTDAPPSLSSLRRDPASESDYSALLVTLRQEEQRTFSSAELQASRLPSLFDDGVFEVRPALPVNGQRTFRSKHTPAQQAEFTAFQFQR